MIKPTARLALAVTLAIFCGSLHAGELWYQQSQSTVDATLWGGYTGVRVQATEDSSGSIDIGVNAGTPTVNGGLTMTVHNYDDERETASVSLTVEGAGTAVTFTSGANIIGVEGAEATLTVQDGGSLSFGGASILYDNVRVLVTDGGTLGFDNVAINDLTIEMPFPTSDDPENPIDIDDVPSTIDVKGGTMNVSGALVMQNGRISVRDGGTLNTGFFRMYGGSNGLEVFIREGAGFNATDATAESHIANGAFTIEAGGPGLQFLGGFRVDAGGIMTITRDIDVGSNGMAISNGGEVTIGYGSTVVGEYLHVANGTLYFNSGEIGGTVFTISGDDSQVFLMGTIAERSQMTISGGETHFMSGAVANITALHVGGTAMVNIQTTVSTAGGLGSFSFVGGDIHIGGGSYWSGGGSLDVGRVGQDLSFSGNFRLEGGSLVFRDNVSMTGGGIHGSTGTSRIDMNANKLTIAAGAILDAGEGNIRIENSGGLSIAGAYRAGYDGNSVTMVTSEGGGTLYVSSQAQIQMSSALQRLVNNPDTDLSDLIILATDGANYSGATELVWNSGGWEYEYEVRQNANGQWGLYVTGSTYLTEDQQYQNMLEAWKKQPQVGENASKLITKEFAGVVIRANGIVTGASGDYEALSRNGQFNADVLSTFLNPRTSGATYDGLMLYNGSGLGFVNQAVINSNYNLLRRLRLRNDDIRSEMRVTSENLCSALPDHSACCLDGDKNRVWVGTFYTNENSGHDEGFDGYHFRSTGMIVGYDRLFGNVSVGGAFSYSGGDFQDSSALENSSHINTYGFTAYGSYNSPNGVFVNGALGYAYSDNQIRDYRALFNSDPTNPLEDWTKEGWNTADYHTNTFMINANVGYDYVYCEDLTITGSIGISYQWAENASHSQFFHDVKGEYGFNTLNAGEVSNYSLTTPIEVAVRYNVFGDEDQLFTVFGNIGYAYEFNNSGPEGTITYGGLEHLGRVHIVSRHPGRHILNVGLGAKYYYKQYEFGLGYEYTGRTKYNSHHFQGNFGVVF